MNVRFIQLPLLLMLALLASSCKPRRSTPPAPPQPPVVEVPKCGNEIREGVAPESAMISGLTTNVAGDCLELKLTYSGGCKPHSFDLYWDGNWAESMPPQATLTLVHTNNGDHCRELKSEKLSFDLSPLRYKGVGQLILNLKSSGAPFQRANYTY